MNYSEHPPAYSSISEDPIAFYAMAATFYSAIANGSLQIDGIQKLKFQTEITELLKGNTIRRYLMDDVKRLANMVMSIETSFAKITYGMTMIDERKFVVDRKVHYTNFASEWKHLHKEYTSLMFQSQETANAVSDKIDNLFKVIFPLVEKSDVPLFVKQNAIDTYIKNLKNFQAEGKNNAERFSLLRENVDHFWKTVKETFENLQGDIQTRIGNLDQQIATLKDQLKMVSTGIGPSLDVFNSAMPDLKSASKQMKFALEIVSLVAGVSTLATLAPPIGIAILAIGLVAFGFYITRGMKKHLQNIQGREKALEELQGQLTACQNEHDDAIWDRQLKQVLVMLRDVNSDFEQMIPKLSSIQEIWDMLVADSQKLSRLLSSPTTADNAQILQTTAEGVKATYETLKLAVDQYSLAVAQPE